MESALYAKKKMRSRKKTNSMLQPQRQRQILEILRKDMTIRGSRLSELLGVSEMTIRRDLDILEKKGAVVERSMISHTQAKVIVIADYSKFGRVAEISIAPLKYINVLVTSRKIPHDFQREFELMGGQVVIA